MTFIWPSMLIFLAVVPLFILLYRQLQQRRRRLATDFGSSGLAQTTAAPRTFLSRHLPALLFLAGLIILILSLARPETTVNLPRVEGTAILVFDVSHSMAATDVEPSRMEATKAAAREFVQRQPPTVQIGIVTFSSNGFAVQTPTNDPVVLLAAIDRLEPQRGTSLGQGILAALNTIAVDAGLDLRAGEPGGDTTTTPNPLVPFEPDTENPGRQLPEGSFPSSVIVLFSDGENTDNPEPLLVAQAAQERDVRIYTVGVGTPGGTTLDIDGFTIFTRLDETSLQQIAQLTGGAYYNAGKEQDLLAIYQNITPQVAIKSEKMEVTSIFAGASLFTLLIGGMFSLLWFSRLP